MITTDESKRIARELAGPDGVSHAKVLEAAAHAAGFRDWNTFVAMEWSWQHQFEPDLPVYAEIRRAGSVLHLSGHHGDATPGGAVMIVVPDLREYQAQLIERRHRNARPGIDEDPWGLTMTVPDPFGNRLTFWERT